jgi:hypothetical protein
MSEHEFDRTRSTTTTSDSDHDIAPNRISRSAQLDAPTNPVASGIVWRKARDANGVADGADAAVANASTSTGFALPETLMRKFESSLGADLSSVRVHTGSESQGAADAVGAKAYTMGQDIHFGAGHYDPGSSAGEHLLAHEVAHTVQQAGSTPIRQNKLEVSSPDDAAEHEADSAAANMVSGTPFSVARTAGGASRKIFRERKWDWSAGGKVTPVADGLVKIQAEGSAKVEQPIKYVTVSGQLSAAAEAEVKWKPDANGMSASGKGTTGKDGKVSGQLEGEVPLWREAATKAAQEEAEKSWTDYFSPVEASLVFGADGSTKDAKGSKPGETKGALSLGVKCKTKSGDNWTVKLQFFEMSKKGEVLDIAGPAVKGNYDKKFKCHPIDVKMGELAAKMTVTGSVKPELTFKPNWEQIAQEVAMRSAEEIATDAINLAIDAAAVAGPPLLVAAIIAQGIYIAGEKGTRDSALIVGARDARQGAMDYAQMMCGETGMGTGPIAQEAQAKARAKLAEQAAANHVSVDAWVIALRTKTNGAFPKIHLQTEIQARAAYHDKVQQTIGAWLKQHYLAAIWTTPLDETNAVWKMIEMEWKI